MLRKWILTEARNFAQGASWKETAGIETVALGPTSVGVSRLRTFLRFSAKLKR
jgi:hypothetical protein